MMSVPQKKKDNIIGYNLFTLLPNKLVFIHLSLQVCRLCKFVDLHRPSVVTNIESLHYSVSIKHALILLFCLLNVCLATLF